MKPDCQLKDLKGVRKKLKDAVMFRTVSQLAPILKNGFAATSAGSNGAINIWIDDKGNIHSNSYFYCELQDETTHTSVAKAKVWTSEWLKKIA